MDCNSGTHKEKRNRKTKKVHEKELKILERIAQYKKKWQMFVENQCPRGI
uniref:Uncharacterized protein n=1 Tax=Arion vulgaris TaxID=1028688 RepID=A0A0B7BXB6_9EUPU